MKKTTTILLFSLAVLSAVLLITRWKLLNVSKEDAPAKQDKMRVTASIYPVYFFSREIGGEKAEVVSLLPPGVTESHDFEPTAQDIAGILSSRVLVVNGSSFEQWTGKIGEQLQENNVLLVEASSGLLQGVESVKNGDYPVDPHVWLDPVLASKEAENIEAGFEKTDARHAAFYRKNLEGLTAKFRNLDDDFRKGLGNCKLKDFVTSHAAFGYLSTRYSLNQIPISGISPDKEPSPKKMAEITDFIKQKNIRVVFTESRGNSRFSDTIASETGAQVLTLDPLEGLSEENRLSGNDYFSVMRKNLSGLRVALECK